MTRAGLTKAKIQTLTSRRILVPAGRGVYVKAAQAMALTKTPTGSVALRVAKALIVTGPQAAGSHLDAAVIHRLDTLSRLPKDKVAVTRAPEAPHSRRTRAEITLHIEQASLPIIAPLTWAYGSPRWRGQSSTWLVRAPSPKAWSSPIRL
jgi:hypothetical protein